MSALETTPVFRPGVRIPQFLGVDRELGMALAVICIALSWASMTLIGFVLGGALWLFGMWSLRRAAKADPLLRQVYIASTSYQGWYPARSTPWRR